MDNISKENKEKVQKITMEKVKVEDELRSAVLEKNLLRDSERILLNTFDTLKMHYEARKSSEKAPPKESHQGARNNGKESTQDPQEFKCDKCEHNTKNKGILRSHIVNKHKVEPSLYENRYDKNRKETYICEECHYRIPFIANINVHKSEAHGKWQEVRRKNKPSSQTNGRRE